MKIKCKVARLDEVKDIEYTTRQRVEMSWKDKENFR